MPRPSLTFRLFSAIRLGFQFHGIWLPIVILHRLWIYLFRKLFVSRTFSFAGKKLPYLLHPFALNTERTVEIAIAMEFLKLKTGQILELGNVLSNYSSFTHDIVDKYEIAPGVINEDIISFSPNKRYNAIVTLSTLEHVGWDETPQEPEKILQAITRLKELLEVGGELLLTMPLGYSSYLGDLVYREKTGFKEIRYLRRITANNQWREAQLNEVLAAHYNTPCPCANAIMVGLYQKVEAS